MAREGLGFEITELRLGLPIQSSRDHGNEKKRIFSEMVDDDDNNNGEEGKSGTGIADDRRGRKRNRVVGWPPVCSYRRRNKDQSETGKKYVKVSMDGAPFLRKLDLGMVKGYAELGVAMENLFGCSIKSFEYIHTYEDGDGDWMLMGDVPWKMFVESCSRLRIMKRSEANGSEMPLFSQSRSASSK